MSNLGYEEEENNKKSHVILINASKVGTNIVGHEVYHACVGHNKTRKESTNRFYRNLYYALVAEPTAQLYTAWGIKL